MASCVLVDFPILSSAYNRRSIYNMGAAASIDGDTMIDLAVAKKEAGERWTSAEDEVFAARFAETGQVNAKDARCLAPKLFYGDNMNLESAQLHSKYRGVEWNEELNAIFEANATAITNAAGTEEKAVPTDVWKGAVPTLFETAEDRATRIQNEYLAMLVARAEGNVVINYQMYNEQFPISGNTLTAARIDEDYGLTDVMPGCRIRLSAIDSKARTLYENAHDGRQAPWVREDPEGTFKDLLAGETYYCIVFEDAAQYKKDMAELQKRLAAEGKPSEPSKNREQEGCSCLFGNPCMDQYICRDWDNRYAVAKKNGWKGF
jgi:hypothetical protein